MGFTTTAAQERVDMVRIVEIPTPLSLPPGAVVVSTNTMVELPNCSWGVEEVEGVKVGVTVVDFVTVGLGDGVVERLTVEEVVGVLVPEEPPLGVGVSELLAVGVGLGEGSTMPCTYMPAP